MSTDHTSDSEHMIPVESVLLACRLWLLRSSAECGDRQMLAALTEVDHQLDLGSWTSRGSGPGEQHREIAAAIAHAVRNEDCGTWAGDGSRPRQGFSRPATRVAGPGCASCTAPANVWRLSGVRFRYESGR